MSKAVEKLQSQVERLRRQLAEAEAVVGQLKSRLARLESKLTGEPAPETGLDLLWTAALPIARTRSSKIQCRTEWLRIPAHDRPTVTIALDALTKWNRCPEWRKDGNCFVPGLHRWIKARQWENLPEGSDKPAASRYRLPEKAVQPAIGETVTDAAEIAKLLSIRAPRMNS